ncbi:hypothetical protein [Roseicella sp. DB1501]|uniref:hypothetical protein n=1 Tax=Roseicella sp. DB1501 TaxID=2730925 RepID=UPI0014918A0D|nr:hypothetical protein [Roseicella sp. DB1501]NOG73798.1 hypothetical protein [Roseicella sp. DB1501]
MAAAQQQPQTILEWRRDPVRIRPAPNAAGVQTAAQDLPVRPKVQEVTPDGVLGFDGRDGRRRYVLRDDVITDTVPVKGVCPEAPSRPGTTVGTPRATNQRDAGRSEQGMGTGRKC